MVRVTEDLIRSRAEHNEGILSTLEELSMHLQHIEKLELFDKLCRNLKILMLQNNIVSKIENMGNLKKLEYLNMSLNNLEVIEGLEGCESLEKVDLTLNFIGDLLSIKSLQGNYMLRELSLQGNPCSKYEGYRYFVIHTLPQLKTLDGKPVLQTEKIKARQEMENNNLEVEISKQQIEFLKEWEKREKMKTLDEYLAEADEEDEEDVFKRLWSEKGSNTPELRVLMSELSLRQERKEEKPKPKKKEQNLFNSAGKPLNINNSNLKFKLTEDLASSCLVLTIFLPKSFDSSDMEADVQPWYIRVQNKKGLIFQLTLLHEVCPDKAKAERSMATGKLVITAPMVSELLTSYKVDDFQRFKNLEMSKKNSIKSVAKLEANDVPPESNFDLSEVPDLEEVQ